MSVAGNHPEILSHRPQRFRERPAIEPLNRRQSVAIRSVETLVAVNSSGRFVEQSESIGPKTSRTGEVIILIQDIGVETEVNQDLTPPARGRMLDVFD